MSARPTRLSARPDRNKELDNRITALISACLSQPDPDSSLSHPIDTKQLTSATQHATSILDPHRLKKGALGESQNVPETIEGLVLKHSLNLDDALSKSLRSVYSSLRSSVNRSVLQAREARELQQKRLERAKRLAEDSQWDPTSRNRPVSRGEAAAPRKAEPLLDGPRIDDSNVDDIVQLLLHLSRPPSVETHGFAAILQTSTDASARRHLSPEARIAAEWEEYNRIFEQEPLRGEGWDDDPERERLEEELLGSDQWTDDEETQSIAKESKRHKDRADRGSFPPRPVAKTSFLKDRDTSDTEREEQERKIALDLLHSKQYWRAASVFGPSLQPFSLNRPSTIALCFDSHDAAAPHYITELHAVRESIFALSGCPSILFSEDQTNSGRLIGDSKAYESIKVLHLSPDSYASCLDAISRQVRLNGSLRSFTRRYVSSSAMSQAQNTSAALFALAWQVDRHLSIFTDRIGGWETAIAQQTTPFVASLLQLTAFVQDCSTGLAAVHAVLTELGLCGSTAREAPVSTAAVLDKLHQALEAQVSLERCAVPDIAALSCLATAALPLESNNATSELAECFLACAEPVWQQVLHWVATGSTSFGAAIDSSGAPDFFIERNAKVPVASANCWDDGWTLRRAESKTVGLPPLLNTDSGNVAVPAFLEPLADDILEAGKSVGLLRLLGLNADIPGEWERHGLTLREIVGVGPTSDETDLDSIPSLTHDSDDSHELETSYQAPPPLMSLPVEIELEPAEKLVRSTFLFGNNSQDLTTAAVPDLPEFLETPTELKDKAAVCVRLSSHLQSHLATLFTLIQHRLHNALTLPGDLGGWHLPAHLEAIHGIFLFRQGADMTRWCETLWSVADRHLDILDYDFLNSTFREQTTIDSRASGLPAWVDTSLVRFRYSASSRRRQPGSSSSDETGQPTLGRMLPSTPNNSSVRILTVRSLADLRVEYMVPFPLGYFFTASAMRSYEAVFTFMLQLHRTRYLVDRLGSLKAGSLSNQLDLGAEEAVHDVVAGWEGRPGGPSSTSRIFAAHRLRLQWFVRTIHHYVAQDVVHACRHWLLKELESRTGLEAMRTAHGAFLDLVKRASFVEDADPEIEEIHERLLDILDGASELKTAWEIWRWEREAEFLNNASPSNADLLTAMKLRKTRQELFASSDRKLERKERMRKARARRRADRLERAKEEQQEHIDENSASSATRKVRRQRRDESDTDSSSSDEDMSTARSPRTSDNTLGDYSSLADVSRSFASEPFPARLRRHSRELTLDIHALAERLRKMGVLTQDQAIAGGLSRDEDGLRLKEVGRLWMDLAHELEQCK